MTTRVTFYQLRTRQPDGKFRLACHIVNTAFKNGHKVYVNVENQAQCAYLNELLWKFSQNSFIPHTVFLETVPIDTEKFPVVVGSTQPSQNFNDVLVTLLDDVPDFIHQFSRVVEPIDADERDIEKAKLRSKKYASLLGTTPSIHMITRRV